ILSLAKSQCTETCWLRFPFARFRRLVQASPKATDREDRPMHHPSRRGVVAGLMTGAAALAAARPAPLLAAAPSGVAIGDGTIALVFDAGMRLRVDFAGQPLTAPGGGGALRLVGGATLDRFLLLDHTAAGSRHTLRATASGQVEQTTVVSFDPAYPGVAVIETRYRNTGPAPVAVAGWRAATFDVLPHPDGAWTFAGASYPDRRDWIQPVKPGFEQRNFMGMNGADYGGGTPVAVVWCRDAGL